MEKFYKQLILNLIKSSPKTDDELLIIKRKFSKENKVNLPTNSKLLSVYRELLKNKSIKENKQLEMLFIKRRIRTLSGVAPIAVLTKPYECPGKCVYCPTEKAMPKSYLSNEPAVMRAQLCNFNPFKQVGLRIQALENNGHNTNKLELIIMGGTWDYFPEKYKLWYIYACFKAANNPAINIKNKKISIDKKIKLKTQTQVTWEDLKKEQKKNETAKHRIVGLTLETRPDYVTEKTCWEMRKFGCTRVEIGVQHLDDKILTLNKRGHGVKETIQATKLLRQFGFKITYHMMPNLPGSTVAKDLKMFRDLFSNPEFQPDLIKIYPCVVTQGSELYKWWKAGKYKSYTDKQLRNLLIKIKEEIIPYYVRIIRVIRDIPEESIVAGNKITNLRHLLHAKCKCIRCREVGHSSQKHLNKKPLKHKLFIQKYKAGNGMEYFLSYESADRKILYAFLRLRIPHTQQNNKTAKQQGNKFDWVKNIPMIREIHTYGQMVPVGSKIKSASQHKGLGKKLILEAEKITKKSGFKQIAVISGIGVRNYYRKLGFKLKNIYLVKSL